MHARYAPMFAALNINSEPDRHKAVAYFRGMAQNLIDCHYNLSFTDTLLADSAINPSELRRKNVAPSIPYDFFMDSIRSHYLGAYYRGDTFYLTTSITTGLLDSFKVGVITGLINNNILYFHLNTFYLQAVLNQRNPYWLGASWNWFLSKLHNQQATAKGIIIDMRSNNGGMISDLDFIAGQIVGQPTHFADTRGKSGNGRLDYSPWIPAMATPPAGATGVGVPIIVLTDRHSVSMAEMTTMALRSLPNTIVLGDTTWGANGPLDPYDQLYGGGQFFFAGYGFVYTSSAEYRYHNGKIYEGKGFPPDIYVPVNTDSLAAGIDVQLEAAIKLLDQ